MDSWWQLGESIGYAGSKLALYQITCPFCMEKGNFKTAHHAEKKKPNSDKKLNFDTLECGSCSSYVMVLWSATEHEIGSGHHEYRVLPWALKYDKYPQHWPEAVGRYWLQAKRSMLDENWDAAAVMARSALQIALRDCHATGKNLKQEINDLASKGILPPTMVEWSEHVRELGNDSAHPDPGQGPTNPQDARDILSFLDFLLEYLFTLPHRIEQYRARTRKAENNKGS
jgi:Domain of unknown function (DUF4145)